MYIHAYMHIPHVYVHLYIQWRTCFFYPIAGHEDTVIHIYTYRRMSGVFDLFV